MATIQHACIGGEERLGGASSSLPKRAHEMFKLLTENGWTATRVTGSHHIFRKEGVRCIPVAVHGGEVNPGLARLVLKQAGLFARQPMLQDGGVELMTCGSASCSSVDYDNISHPLESEAKTPLEVSITARGRHGTCAGSDAKQAKHADREAALAARAEKQVALHASEVQERALAHEKRT
eukprot:CAMPEP_0198225788 /NCGR_PEP_ID=MMETSP1445-20131203/102592_1 /TAXON_ID=36898 /ORGANISM="Pyramimonas sp., Strain CCMP2087" /LENGTH=179 /DNA_ID=CAMNT_0043905421 /DNA_START=395 /DNA_END=930 /DNA_ORIENTATION=+